MRSATARHILVETQQQCEDIKSRLIEGADFAALAKQYSLCPSGEQGGDLGEFYPGQMVPEFDKVVFSEQPGKVYGPVQTEFGYHLIEITSRSDD
ncbi:MAG: peptidylprolyl isomerase [Gammaproteobacteria bacterium]|jgi:peptidyl-prolyl cis-trans isomerase C